MISGFLGSGKTTLLNRLLQDPRMDSTAVLINELGEVGIDNLIVDQFDDDIVLLESGCVCCSVRDDLTASLLKLHHRGELGQIPPFEQAVLETTGIADLPSILQLLMSDKPVCERYRLGSVVTVVDACFGPANLRDIPEASRQVVMADRLVMSKTDLADDAGQAALRDSLRALNPGAPCFQSADVTPEQLFSHMPDHSDKPKLPHVHHDARFATFQVAWDHAVEWSAIETWIEGLLSARGDDVYRIKGLINVTRESRPTVFQSVQHSVYAPSYLTAWPGGKPYNELTFITQHFSRRAALASLRPFVSAV